MKLRTLIASIVALVGVSTAQAADGNIYWIGPVSGGNWNDAANWACDKNATGPISRYTDWNRVTNQVPVEIFLDANQDLKGLILNNNVDLTLIGDNVNRLQYFGGSFKGESDSVLRLKDIVLIERGGSAYPTFTISVPKVEIVEGGKVALTANGNYPQKTTTISSALTGKGKIEIGVSTADSTIWKFTGDNSNFEGVLTAPTATSKATVLFAAPTSGSAKAKFNFETTTEGTVTIDCPSDSTLQFGELTGAGTLKNANSESTVTLEVGALGSDFSCGLNFGGMNVRKVGAGMMVFSGSNVGVLTQASGTVCLMDGATVEKLAVEGGAINVAHSAFGKAAVVTIAALADGTTADALESALSAGVELTDNGDGSYTLTRAAESRPNTFTWRGGFNGDLWLAPANWVTSTGALSVEAPGAEDKVVFPATESMWTVELAAESTVAEVEFAGATMLRGSSLCPGKVTGDGKIVMGDNARIMRHASNLLISNAIEIVASAEAPATFYLPGASQTIELAGKITGVGTFKCSCADGKNYSGVKISADLREFAGTLMMPRNSLDRNCSELKSANAVSSNAVYEVGLGNCTFMSVPDNSHLSFGMLKGSFSQQDQSNTKKLTIEMDCLGRDGSLAGSAFSTSYPNLATDRGHTFRKVGAGTVQFSVRLAKEIDINNGVLEMASDQVLETMYKPKGSSYELTTNPDEATGTHNTDLVFGGGTLKIGESLTVDPSAHIKASDANIQIEVSDDRIFATALPIMNGGLVKKGAGTLTLAKRPAYTGATRIEGGKLVVEDVINLGTGSSVVVDDPAAAYAAGTVYLEATRIVGKATIDTKVDPEVAKVYRLVKKTVADKTCLCVDKVGGFALIFK